MSYVVPRGHDVVIGGAEEYGVESLSFDLDPDALVRRCSQLCAWLADPSNVAVVSRVVGLRPWRSSGVRLCRDGLSDATPVIHNYGHWGSGFSLAWGSAADVPLSREGEVESRSATSGSAARKGGDTEQR
jgi:D-amino-acid oxidase